MRLLRLNIHTLFVGNVLIGLSALSRLLCLTSSQKFAPCGRGPAYECGPGNAPASPFFSPPPVCWPGVSFLLWVEYRKVKTFQHVKRGTREENTFSA